MHEYYFCRILKNVSWRCWVFLWRGRYWKNKLAGMDEKFEHTLDNFDRIEVKLICKVVTVVYNFIKYSCIHTRRVPSFLETWILGYFTNVRFLPFRHFMITKNISQLNVRHAFQAWHPIGGHRGVDPPWTPLNKRCKIC